MGEASTIFLGDVYPEEIQRFLVGCRLGQLFRTQLTVVQEFCALLPIFVALTANARAIEALRW